MEITLNHTIVPSLDRSVSAKWYETIFGFEYLKDWGPFAVVRVNSTLSLDFMETGAKIPLHHYAFKVDDQAFDDILSRVLAGNIKISSNPHRMSDDTYDGEINHLYGGRGVYFKDPNGHMLEILTVDYDLEFDPTLKPAN
ncbi:MAG: VOC family protein [Kordiimonadaceae bacterium]|nr:VOC family protein [Kordiimonadaceae bacterium]